jgi:hypothetical protein
VREHWEAIEDQTGQRPSILDGPELPDALDYLWRWFRELSAYRTLGFMGPEPIRPIDRYVYFLEEDTRPERWEIMALARLDVLWLGVRADGGKGRLPQRQEADDEPPRKRRKKG